MYLIAFLCPPLAILLTGRIFQALFCIPACICGLLPGMLWSLLVVADHKANKRADRMADRIARKSGKGDVTTNVQVNNVVNVNIGGETSGLVAEMLADQQRAARIAARRAEEHRRLEIAEQGRQIVRILAAAPLALKQLPAVSVRAYHELPEWGQPVVWGLAAGTPFSIIAAFMFLRSK